MPKTSTVVMEVLDERGRVIYPHEFRWLMNYFQDRYDPRRLAFAVGYESGLRLYDFIRLKFMDFTPDFAYLKTSQCKATVSKKDNVVRVRKKPKCIPLSGWLQSDLYNYASYRLAVGQFVGKDIEHGRLFPTLREHQFRQLFKKLRDRHKDTQQWLNDVWMKEIRYRDGKMYFLRMWYRVSPHACRANYATAAYEVTNHDLMKTKALTGHSETKHLEKYVKVNDIEAAKKVIKERFMDGLVGKQEVPLLIGQRRLDSF